MFKQRLRIEGTSELVVDFQSHKETSGLTRLVIPAVEVINVDESDISPVEDIADARVRDKRSIAQRKTCPCEEISVKVGGGAFGIFVVYEHSGNIIAIPLQQAGNMLSELEFVVQDKIQNMFWNGGNHIVGVIFLCCS